MALSGERGGDPQVASAETCAGAQDFRHSAALRGGAGGVGMLQLPVSRGALASARLLFGSTMPKKASATSKASGKSRGVERVGRRGTEAAPGGRETSLTLALWSSSETWWTAQ